jgi:AcrR family transcriptional regulator
MMVTADDSHLHPTAQKLVDTVIEMLQTTSYNNIKSENVLARSGITRGPLYHHFADFDDLIQTAQIQLYKTFVLELTSQLMKVIEATEDLESARNELHRFVEMRSTKISYTLLRQRVGIIHNAASIPSLRERLNSTQEALTKEWMKAYQICVDKGWADSNMDPRSVAVLMQSSFIGRVLDGMSNVQMDVNEWIKVLNRLFDCFFFVGANPTT